MREWKWSSESSEQRGMSTTCGQSVFPKGAYFLLHRRSPMLACSRPRMHAHVRPCFSVTRCANGWCGDTGFAFMLISQGKCGKCITKCVFVWWWWGGGCACVCLCVCVCVCVCVYVCVCVCYYYYSFVTIRKKEIEENSNGRRGMKRRRRRRRW